MVDETSIKAYREIIAEGLLGDMQVQVADYISKTPNCTDKEMSEATKMPINCVTPRRNELVKMGVVEDMGTRKCSITGRTAHYWRVKDRIEFAPLPKQVKP